MRINSISPRNLNFKRFLDDNARQVVKQALVPPPEKEYKGLYSYPYFKRIEECQYLDVYTDTDGKVKGKFGDEFVKNADKDITFYINDLKRGKHLEDLSNFDATEETALCIKDIDDLLAGIDPIDKMRSQSDDKPQRGYAEMRAEEEAYHG